MFAGAVKSFEDLEAWKTAREIKMEIYLIANKLPEQEKYNLASQMRKAAISVTANIAEGYGRYHYQENIQFLRIARGSLYELKDHLISCLDFNYIKQNTFKRLESIILSDIRLIDGMIRHIKNKMEKM